jgi:hypothetical protein
MPDGKINTPKEQPLIPIMVLARVGLNGVIYDDRPVSVR